MRKLFILFILGFLTSLSWGDERSSLGPLNTYKTQIAVSTGTDAAAIAALQAKDIAQDAAVLASTTSTQNQINNLVGTSQRFYLNSNSYLGTQYLGTSITVQTSEFTQLTTVTGTSDVIISSFIIDMGNITTIPSGLWELEFYATVPSGVVQKAFEVWNGSGTEVVGVAGYLINKSAYSTPLASVKSEDAVNFTTTTISVKSKVLTLITYAKRSSGGASLTVTTYKGGISDAHLTFPVLRADVSVTKIKAGVGNSISPTTGVGDVTINVTPSTACAKVDGILDGSVAIANYYSTGTIYVVFGSTDISGDVCQSTVTYPNIPNDLTIIGWGVAGDVSGNCEISVSSAAFGANFKRIDGTDAPDLFAQSISSSTALTGWSTSVGVGGSLRFVLIDAVTSRHLTLALKYKKWAR